MDEGKRKEIFVEFQKHMYDNAVAMKAGNYGLFQVATREAEELQALPHPAHVGRVAGAVGSRRGGVAFRARRPSAQERVHGEISGQAACRRVRRFWSWSR